MIADRRLSTPRKPTGHEGKPMPHLPLPRFRPLWIACALAIAFAARAEAAAKPPAGPVGWVLNFNYGAGNLSMDGDSLGRDFGLGIQLRISHILDSKFQTGFQVRAWNSS